MPDATADKNKRKPPSRLTHGHAIGQGTPTYKSWLAMHDRCSRPKHRHYRYYGGRGVKVCDRWSGKDGFQAFLSDMGIRPAGKTLDRYPDGKGNYEPENCRWATPKQQQENSDNRSERQINCGHCGVPFEAKRVNAAFCCAKCRRADFDEHAHDGRVVSARRVSSGEWSVVVRMAHDVGLTPGHTVRIGEVS